MYFTDAKYGDDLMVFGAVIIIFVLAVLLS